MIMIDVFDKFMHVVAIKGKKRIWQVECLSVGVRWEKT